MPHFENQISRSAASVSYALRVADAMAYSSLLAAAVAGSLALAASLVLEAPTPPVWIFLASTGTFIIYNVDRLRDLDRDSLESPFRTAFVRRHRPVLYTLVAATACAFGVVLLQTSVPVVLLCAAIGCVGLFHRRLKQSRGPKAFYVSASWVAATVGLPWIASGNGERGLSVAVIFGLALIANLIASNLGDEPRDHTTESAPAERDHGARSSACRHKRLWTARALCGLATLVAIAGPGSLLPLLWIPLSEGLALLRFKDTERYGHLAIDGALFIGALASTTHLQQLA